MSGGPVSLRHSREGAYFVAYLQHLTAKMRLGNVLYLCALDASTEVVIEVVEASTQVGWPKVGICSVVAVYCCASHA